MVKNYKSPNNLYKIDDIAQICRLIRESSAPIKHILFRAPSSHENNHGVTLSIIARKGQKHLLIYTDSNNIALTDTRPDYVIPYFVVRFITELDAVYNA